MNKYIKALFYVFGSIFLLTLFLSILSYFNIVNQTIYKIILSLIPILSMIVGGLILGKSSQIKGYIEGLKLSILVIILFVFFSFLFKINFNWTNFIYYLVLSISSMIGSMIGINTKKK